MRRLLLEFAVAGGYWLARLLVLLPNWTYLAILAPTRRLLMLHDPKGFPAVLTGELVLILRDPEAARMGRRMISEARKGQFKALIRGALR